MAEVFNLIRYNIVNVLIRMDMIYIYDSFSLLDFFVALLIFGAVLPVFVITVNNWGSRSRNGDTVTNNYYPSLTYHDETSNSNLIDRK